MEAQPVDILAELAERVEIAVADGAPVFELDAQLERAAGGGDECILVDAQHPVERLDRRDRRLSDPDGADFLAFDQADARAVARQEPR